MYCWLCVPKPVNTFRLMSATPSPSVSLKYQMSGGAATNTPPFQQATPPAQSKMLGEHGGRVVDAVAVRVPQQPHAAQRLVARLGVIRVVDHLGDVEVAVLVDGPRDGAADVGLRGEQLHVEAGNRLECFEHLAGVFGGIGLR